MNIKTYLVDVCLVFFPIRQHIGVHGTIRDIQIINSFTINMKIFSGNKKIKPRINKAEISRRKPMACPPILDLQLSSELDSDK